MNNRPDSWMQQRWRPLMAMQYMAVCIADFIVFPILFTIIQFWGNQGSSIQFTQWTPISLQNGGLYHIAMGAVLGITAWSRGQEKLAGIYKQDYKMQDVEVGYGGKLAPPKTTEYAPR